MEDNLLLSALHNVAAECSTNFLDISKVNGTYSQSTFSAAEDALGSHVTVRLDGEDRAARIASLCATTYPRSHTAIPDSAGESAVWVIFRDRLVDFFDLPVTRLAGRPSSYAEEVARDGAASPTAPYRAFLGRGYPADED
ncbi:hypothetical protein [Sphaerisporangium flaviroseum]|uniref:hypothetical protein n=1 Tax=Sphaerisporangium flaviroseum TaxID=509199 RepID=UPI0031EA075B